MLLRSVVSCATVRPRYSVSTAAPELRNLSAISAMAAAFSGLATGPPSEMKRRRRLPLTKGAPAQARGSRHTTKVCRSPTILRWLPACCGTFDHPARGSMTTGGLWSVSSVRAARQQSKSALAREASHRTGGSLEQKSEAAPMIRCGLEVQARGQTISGLDRLFLDQKVLRAALIQRNTDRKPGTKERGRTDDPVRPRGTGEGSDHQRTRPTLPRPEGSSCGSDPAEYRSEAWDKRARPHR